MILQLGDLQKHWFTQDNAKPSFLSRINYLYQFMIPQTILSSPGPTTTPVWARLTTVASELASRSLAVHEYCALCFYLFIYSIRKSYKSTQ